MIPLTGKAAAFQFCQSAHLKGEVWFKASWNSSNPLPVWWERKKDGSPVNYVYKGNVDPDRQQLTLVLCRYGGTDENGDTIWLPTRTHFVDGHRHLSELTELGATVFFYANQPIGGISNNHVQAPGLFFYEVDHLSLEEQWQALDRFIERTGLEPCAVVFTGGKSLHVYFRPNRPLTPEEWHELNWKLTIVQDGDPAINNLARAMRWPGLVRVKDGVSTHISLERYSDASYSPEEIRRALDSTNLFPHGCSKEHQRLWRNAALRQRSGEEVDPLEVLRKSESELCQIHYEAGGDRSPLSATLPTLGGLGSFQYLRGRCDICRGERKDCRRNPQTNTIYCRSSRANPIDWIRIGEDKHGFGKWRLKSDFENAKRESWQEKQRQKQLHRQQRQLRLKKLLSIKERDRQQREVINSRLPLSRKHRQYLEQVRGLTPAEIDFAYQQGWLRTWNPGQQIYGISPDFAGVIPENLRLAGVPGIAVSAPDEYGRLTGSQIASDDRDQFGKYIWLSSLSKGGNGPHLPNGELPLFVRKHPEATHINEVWIVEGALKSLLVAIALWFRHNRTDIAVIGAGGSNHASSPEALKAAITAFNPHQIVLCPDAGAIANITTLEAYQATKSLVGEVSVVWWGQVAKPANKDIDELLLAGEPLPSCISWEEFRSYWQEQPENISVAHGNEHSANAQSNGDRRISQEEWQVKHGLGNAVRQAFTRLHQKFANIFEKKRPQQAAPKPLAIIGDRIVEADQLIDAAAESTKKYVLVAVDGGVGKSHQAGLAFPQQFDVDKLLYISNSGRNPTTGSVEQNFAEMPVRHDGLKIDPNRSTPSGIPFIVWPAAGDETEVEGNCSRSKLFHALSGKNLDSIEDSDSPICMGCPMLNACKHSSGNGYGFRFKRRVAMQRDRIRMHFDSVPAPDKFDYNKTAILIDEAGENARFVESVEATLADLDKNLALLAANGYINEQNQPFFNALRSILSGDTKQPYHGFDEALLRELLPLPAVLDELIEAIKKLTEPNLEFLDTKDSIDYEGMGAKDRKGLGRWSRLLEKESAVNSWQAQKEIADSVVKNFLPLLLEILAGTRRGSLRCDRRILTIAIPNERQLEVVRAAKKVVFMDGTLTRERLAFRLGCKPEEIEVIRAVQPDYSNAQWIQIVGLGHCGGHSPTDAMKAKLAALRQTYAEQDPLTVFTYFKSLVEDESADGAWWVDSRGSNRFAGIANRVTFGTPYKNLGALQLEFNAFSGRCAELGDKNKGTDTDPHLQQFIDEEVQAAFIQDFWRQRSHRHPDKQFRYVSVTDYPLEFVQAALPGVQFTQIDAFSINPAAGSDKEQTLWAMGQALKTAAEQGIKATQSAIADLAGISLAYVKKLAQEWGGWANLKEGILALLLSFNSGSIPFLEPLDEEEQFFKDWLPVVVEEGVAGDEEMTAIAAANVGSAFNLLGCKRFIKVLRASALQVRAEALGLVLAVVQCSNQGGFCLSRYKD